MDAGKQYLNLVTEFYPETLSRVMNYYRVQKKKDSVPHLLVKIYMFQLLRSLMYLHGSHQVAHRDIKPHNLLIDPDTQRLCLCDMGSAKRITQKERSVAYISTRYYRAPELLLSSDHYGVEVDIWAAGCVMAEMLRAGRVLFEGKSNAD